MASYEQATATAVTADGANATTDRPARPATAPTTTDATHDRVTTLSAASPATPVSHDAAKAVEDRSAFPAPSPELSDGARGFNVFQAPTPLDQVVTDAIVVPGDFTNVDVTVYNTKGERMTRAIYVGALDTFPVLAAVDDEGNASLPLLQTTYSDFVVFAESGEPGVDYAWYSTTASTEIFPRRDDHGDIYVKEVDAGRSGLSVGLGGVAFGN
jgi:hypothetical protein